MTAKAVLVLNSGERFEGVAFGATGQQIGEVLIESTITGYQELLTSEPVAGKIVLFTTPHIGNTGTNDEDAKSERVQAAGVIVRDPARRASNFRATREFADDLVDAGCVGIANVDTRAIARIARNSAVAGAPLVAGIFSGDTADLDPAEQIAFLTNHTGA